MAAEAYRRLLNRAKTQLRASLEFKLPFEQDSFVNAGFWYLQQALDQYIVAELNANIDAKALLKQMVSASQPLETFNGQALPGALIALQACPWYPQYCELLPLIYKLDEPVSELEPLDSSQQSLIVSTQARHINRASLSACVG
ncbi:MAG: hypothetical protein OIF35_07440, partial [Cellvibrionaceae bacterium]|nr:hypothetical protein [Cellvibrionaceae bacterium]